MIVLALFSLQISPAFAAKHAAPKMISDSVQIKAATSALAEANTLNPVEGTDDNVLDMVQTIIDEVSSGVKVTISKSYNSQVDNTGAIVYGEKEVSGEVNLKLAINRATATRTITVVVPPAAEEEPIDEEDPVVVEEPVEEPIVKDPDTVNVKDYGAKGDGVNDDTAAINDAINYAAAESINKVSIPDGVYMINTDESVNLKSNIHLELSSGTTLKAIPTSSELNYIVYIKNVDNVTVTGGKIIGDRDSHLGTTGEWGMGIAMYDSRNITVSDISISDCWGDGIYIGTKTAGGYCDTVTVERFKCDNNRRMGLTIISAKNVIIRNGVCSNSNGTAPESGINLEPNYATQVLMNILIENVQTINNGGYGLDFWLGNDKTDVPVSNVSLKIVNHTDMGSTQGTLHDIDDYISNKYNITVV